MQHIFSQIENHPYIKKFFGENVSDKTAALQLCKNMSVEFFKRGDIVMAQGDQSDNKLYVILDGKVGIVINFKGPKPPDGAIYDLELEEKLEQERLNAIQEQETEEEKLFRERIVLIFQKSREEIQKKYIPFGEDPKLQKYSDINQLLREQIENKYSVLTPKNSQIKNNSSNQPPFSIIIDILKQRKQQRQLQLEEALRREQEDYEISKKNSFSQNSDNPKKKQKDLELSESKYVQQIESFGTKVNEIGKGAGFGDKALLAPTPKQAVRNATIIATTPLLCIIVYRKDFLRVVENFSKEAIFKEKIITKEFKFFKDVSSTSLKERLLYYFQDVNLLKNEFLCKEGEEGEGFYFLAEGKVSIQKRLEDTNNIYYQKYQNVSICTIERPTFFCEEIIFSKLDKPKFKYTIQVTSQKAHLFYCSKSNFVYKFPKEAIEELQQFFEARDVSYSQLFNHCKEIQVVNEQIKKQNEKSLNQNIHFMNFQQNKDLFIQMKSSCIDYQVKKVVPQLIDQFGNQQTITPGSPKIQLDEDYDPTIIDFCSKVDVVMKKKQEEKEIIKKIIIQKKIRTDKRTFKSKKSTYKFSRQSSQNIQEGDPYNQSNYIIIQNFYILIKSIKLTDHSDQINESIEQAKDEKTGVNSEEKIKLLRQYFSKGNKTNFDNIDLNLFYNNQDEIYQDNDVNLLLEIKKPKKQISNQYVHQKPNDINEQSEISNNKQKIVQNQLQEQNTPRNGERSPQSRNGDTSKLIFQNFEADELKSPPPEEVNDKKQKKDRLGQNELDIGYLDMFKKQQYYYMVRKGAIKVPYIVEYPQIDLKKKILKKINRRKKQQMEGNIQLSQSFSICQQQCSPRERNFSTAKQQDNLIDQSNFTDISQLQNEENNYTNEPASRTNRFLEYLSQKFDHKNKSPISNDFNSPILNAKSNKNSISIDQNQNLMNLTQEKILNERLSIKQSPLLSPILINDQKIQQDFSLNNSNQTKIQYNSEKFKHQIPKSLDKIQNTHKQNLFQHSYNLRSPVVQKNQNIDDKQINMMQSPNEKQSSSQFMLSKQNSLNKLISPRNSVAMKADSKIDQPINNTNSHSCENGGRKNGTVINSQTQKVNTTRNESQKEHKYFISKPQSTNLSNDYQKTKKLSMGNLYVGNPNNFQITSLTNKSKDNSLLPQVEDKSQSQSLSKGSKMLKNHYPEPSSVYYIGAPVYKSHDQNENYSSNEYFLNKNFLNQKNSQNLNNQSNSLSTSLAPLTKSQSDRNLIPNIYSNVQQRSPQIDNQSKNLIEQQLSSQKIQNQSNLQESQQNTMNLIDSQRQMIQNKKNKSINLQQKLDIIKIPIGKKQFMEQDQQIEGRKQNLNITTNPLFNIQKSQEIKKMKMMSNKGELNSNSTAVNLKKQNSQTFSTSSRSFKQISDNQSSILIYSVSNTPRNGFNFKHHLKQVFVNDQKNQKNHPNMNQMNVQIQQSEQQNTKQAPYFYSNILSSQIIK